MNIYKYQKYIDSIFNENSGSSDNILIYLSDNPHPAAVELLLLNPDKIYWPWFS